MRGLLMGCEYLVQLNAEDGAISIDVLEAILKPLPDYFGRVPYPDDEAFEFRSDATAAPDVMPDVYVIGSGTEIVICQFGDYAVLTRVLGAIVAHFVDHSMLDRIEVLKP